MTRKPDHAQERIRKEARKPLLAEARDLLQVIVEQTVPPVLEAEREEAWQAGKSERTETRLGYRAGYANRTFRPRGGPIEVGVPPDRQGRCRTAVFERYRRSEKALVAAMLAREVQGVSPRKGKTITQELCGHAFSSATMRRLVGQLDAELAKFARRRLAEPYPDLVLDARYENGREDGAVRRSVLAGELASRESVSSGQDWLTSLRQRSLHGVEFVVRDDPAGLRRAMQEVLPETVWPSC
jgi:putative transposase